MKRITITTFILATSTAIAQPPEWAQDAIWYQIFVERFYNGDHSNDPTPHDMDGTYPGTIPTDWQLSRWTSDWYQPDTYFKHLDNTKDFLGNPVNTFDQKTSLRRYGGDLQGVLEKMDYIQSLGVNAIYFNPLNDAPSLHKYDARHWRHIDRNFGPDPIGDAKIFKEEDPADATSWQWTAADKLFLKVINEAHQRNIKVILDYSFNHTGHTFWAWQDVLKNQQSSSYADWYWVQQFDNPQTATNEFSYRGWFGVFDLPEIRETEYIDHADRIVPAEGNIYSEAAKQHIFNVTSRWLDPNGDGDPSDGVDGFRLDVAAEVPFGFWREYRQHVKSINPDAYLVGEVWWEKWPDQLLDPAPFLQGDVFDAVMNYRWYRSARRLFARNTPYITPSEFVKQLTQQDSTVDSVYRYANMNMSASHDTPRLVTSLANNAKYKVDAKALQDKHYIIHKPDDSVYADARLLLIHQFTYIGAPQIWAGDEMGMWGSDDPHTRKPLIWPEMQFDDEARHPLDMKRPTSPVSFDHELNKLYQQLANFRRNSSVLRQGSLIWNEVNDDKGLLSYTRFINNKTLLIAFNLSEQEQVIEAANAANLLLTENDATLIDTTLSLPARSAAIVTLQDYSTKN